jgi:transcriptional regulator with XRE-family HTH domain
VEDEHANLKVVQPDFGIRLKSLRRDNNLSQRALAELIDRSEDLINLIERGVGFVSLDTLERLSLAFQVPVISLFDYSTNGAFIESGGLKWRASRSHSSLIVRNKRVSLSRARRE